MTTKLDAKWIRNWLYSLRGAIVKQLGHTPAVCDIDGKGPCSICYSYVRLEKALKPILD